MSLQKYRAIVFFCSTALLSACGDQNIYVANSLDMKVQFSSKLVLLKFQLDPDFRIRRELHQTFMSSDKALSQIFLNRSDTGEISLGAIFSAEDLRSPQWPVKPIKTFGNKHSLPSLVKAGGLKAWTINEDHSFAKSLHQDDPYLIIGGAFLDPEFDYLPLNFLASQSFKSSSSETVATISILGPTASSLGGIYFLGNYGLNPFVFLEGKKTQANRFLASEALEIIDKGDLDQMSYWDRAALRIYGQRL